MISKGLHVIFATALSSARRVWGTHVCRDDTDNVTDCHLVFIHLVLALSRSDIAQIWMGPGVRGDLMSLVVHTPFILLLLYFCGVQVIRDSLDYSWPRKTSIVDFSFTVVVASDHERSLGIVSSQQIQDVVGVDIWTIIECQSHITRVDAVVNSSCPIHNIAIERTSDARCVGSTWRLVGITCWSVCS